MYYPNYQVFPQMRPAYSPYMPYPQPFPQARQPFPYYQPPSGIYGSIRMPPQAYPYQQPQFFYPPNQSVAPMQSQIMTSPTKNFQSPDRLKGAQSPQRNPLMQSQQVPKSPQAQMQSPSRSNFLTYDQVMERIRNSQQQQQQQPQPHQRQHPQYPQQQQQVPQQQYKQPQQPQQNLHQSKPQQSANRGTPDDELDQRYKNALKSTEEIIKKYAGNDEREQTPPQDENDHQGQYQEEEEDENGMTELALQYEDGYIYRGQGRKPAQREGFGILTDSDGKEIYAGYWKDNVYDGQGRLTNLQIEPLEDKVDWNNLTAIGNGWQQYEGNFYQGKMHGVGTLQLTNGEKFVGEFDDGMIHGEGEFTTADKQIVKGQWDQGYLMNMQE